MSDNRSATDVPDQRCLNCCALIGDNGCIECGHREGDSDCTCADCQWSRDKADKERQASIDAADATEKGSVTA